MINANEIRIGNWVEIRGIGHGSVTSINVKDISTISIKNAHRYVSNSDLQLITPIPITSEILEKCGFKKVADEFYKKDNLYFKNYDMDLCLGGTHYILDDFEDITTGECKYLHQLQNLYFALTGEELNVQL